MSKFTELFNHNKIHLIDVFDATPIGQTQFTPDLTNIGYGSISGTAPSYLLHASAGVDPISSVYSAEVVTGTFSANASITGINFSDPTASYFGFIDSDHATPTFFYDLFLESPSAQSPDLLMLCTRDTNNVTIAKFEGSLSPSFTDTYPTNGVSTPAEVVEFYLVTTDTTYDMWVHIDGEASDIMVASALKSLAPNGVKIFFMSLWLSTRNNPTTIDFGAIGISPTLAPYKGKTYIVNGPDTSVAPGVIAKDGDCVEFIDINTPFLYRDHTRLADAQLVADMNVELNTAKTDITNLDVRTDDLETTSVVLQNNIDNLQTTTNQHTTQILELMRGPVSSRRISSTNGAVDVTIDVGEGYSYSNTGSPYVLNLAALFATTSEVIVDIQNLPAIGGPNGGDNCSVVIQLGNAVALSNTLQEGLVTFTASNSPINTGFNLYLCSSVSNGSVILFHRYFNINQLNHSYRVGSIGLCTLKIGRYHGGFTYDGLNDDIFKVKEIVYEAIPSHCIYKLPSSLDMDLISLAFNYINIQRYKTASRLYIPITKGTPGSVNVDVSLFFQDYFFKDLFIEVDSTNITTYNGDTITANVVYHYTAAITTDFTSGSKILTVPTFVLQNKFLV